MKWSMRLLVLLSFSIPTYGQRIVRDARNLKAEVVNQVARTAADGQVNQRLEAIEKSKRISLQNLTLVEQIQKRVYQSLTTVDKSIRQGKTILSVRPIITDILKYQLRATQYARQDPLLLLFVEQQAQSFKIRAADLLIYIQQFIMAEKKDLLIDVGKRDELLSHVIRELRVLRAVAYTTQQQMYWARQSGIWKKLNPWQRFINQDKQKGEEIVRNFKF